MWRSIPSMLLLSNSCFSQSLHPSAIVPPSATIGQSPGNEGQIQGSLFLVYRGETSLLKTPYFQPDHQFRGRVRFALRSDHGSGKPSRQGAHCNICSRGWVGFWLCLPMTFQRSGGCVSGEPSPSDKTSFYNWKEVCMEFQVISRASCYLIFFNRWKRSVEDFSETWSLDLGLRILAVKEVSCKRRLVSISTTNIFTLQTLRKWPQPLSGVWFAFFDTLLSHLASRPNPPDYIQAKHKPIQVITLLNEEFFQIQSNQHCSSTVCTVYTKKPIDFINRFLSCWNCRLAVKRGLGGADCSSIYSSCRFPTLLTTFYLKGLHLKLFHLNLVSTFPGCLTWRSLPMHGQT